MTQAQLPRRPFREQVPPPDGLARARRTAQRRRRQRAVAAAVIGSGLATVITLLAVLGSGGGVDVLKTVPPATRPSSTPATPTPTVSAHAQTASDQPFRPGAAPSVAGVSPQSVAGPPAAVNSGSSTASGYPRPELVRWQSRYEGTVPHLCQGTSSDSSGSQVNSTVGWCLVAVAQRTSGGMRLTVNVCRDASGGGSLNFDTTREADVTVQRGGASVWDWAHGHPASPSSHSLATTANGCWNWSLTWPDVSQSGASAGHGQFTFVATSTAHELAGLPTASTTFTL